MIASLPLLLTPVRRPGGRGPGPLVLAGLNGECEVSEQAQPARDGSLHPKLGDHSLLVVGREVANEEVVP